MRRYKSEYEFRYLDLKTGHESPFIKRYVGTGWSPNGALNSAIRKFRKSNRFLFSSPTIINISKVNKREGR